MRSLAIRRNSLREKGTVPGAFGMKSGTCCQYNKSGSDPKNASWSHRRKLSHGRRLLWLPTGGSPPGNHPRPDSSGPAATGKEYTCSEDCTQPESGTCAYTATHTEACTQPFPLSQSSSTHPFRSGDNTGQSTGYVIRQFLRHSNFPRYFFIHKHAV